MRKAKDNSNLPKKYYRPELRRCPYCQWKLKRGYTLWSKQLSTLTGRVHVFSQGYHCSHPACPEPDKIYRSAEAETLSVPHSGYGIDVIVEVGYQRFWLRQTVEEIHDELKDRVSISQRQILNLLANFLALLRAGQSAKVAQHRRQWQQLGGLVLSIDGMQPKKGSPALYVVREVQLAKTLEAKVLETGDHGTIATQLLEPIAELGLPLKGIVSDAQESIRMAINQVFPSKPHQNCQFHCLKEAGRPIFEADRAMKTQLKKKLRGRLNRTRQVIQDLSPTNPYRAVLLKYVRYLHFTLLMNSRPPFELGGLRIVEQLTILESSLGQAQKKGGIGSLNV